MAILFSYLLIFDDALFGLFGLITSYVFMLQGPTTRWLTSATTHFTFPVNFCLPVPLLNATDSVVVKECGSKKKSAWPHNATTSAVLYNLVSDHHAVITLGGMVRQV